MLLNADTLDHSSPLRARYCVIGTGMGGAAVAQTLAAAGEDVLLVEAGGLERHVEPSPLIDAEHVGRSFGIPVSRCIELGGTSNQWHGICGPLDEIDFEARPWIPGSGWPIDRSQLDPFYRQAARLLDIGDTALFDSDHLPSAHRERLGDLQFDRTVLKNKLVQVRKPPMRWKDTLVRQARARRWRCLLGASALELVVSESGATVEQVIVGTGRRTMPISADVFVVCAGGLETPRLLLNSNRRLPEGIGNVHRVVGRNLMDHPVGHFCKIGFGERTTAPLYASMPLDGTTALMSGLRVDAVEQRTSELANHYLWVRPSSSPRRMDDDLLYSFLAVRGVVDLRPRQLWAILRNRDILSRVLVHRFGLHPAYRYGDLFFMTEQLPNPDSRVDLSSARRDRYGYPVARVNWQLSEADFEGFQAYARVLFDRGLRADQYALARVDDPAIWRRTVASAAHHLGTARMADDAARGVVDPNLRVFGMENLFVCDGSVFPTVGGVNPSLTITALGVRLGQHLLETRRPAHVTTATGEGAVAV